VEQAITAKVFRFDPDGDQAPRYDTFVVNVQPDEPQTVATLLRAIRRDFDSTLAFRDYSCLKGVCAQCIVSVNGKPVRGCSTRVQPGDSITLEPVANQPFVRDLVVDQWSSYASKEGVPVFKDGTVAPYKGR